MLEQFIRKMPKVELHLHIEGTLEPELMLILADRNKVTLPFKTVEEARQAYQFQNLQSFLDIYYQGLNVLCVEQDFYDLTFAYMKKAQQQNIRHTEIFFDPQAHMRRHISFSSALTGIHRALTEAKKQYHISSKIILCFLRDMSEESALETLKEALPFKEWIVAVGLDSAENGNPPEKFKSVFDLARNHGFLTVAHAGEEGPPEYIWQALDILKVSRIDHGGRCIEDAHLVKRLVGENMPLTVCPLSNIRLHVVDKLENHPLKQMLNSGLCVTVNSDDPAYFGGYIQENYFAIQKALAFTKDEIYQMAKNAIFASFTSAQEKAQLQKELDQSYFGN